MNHNSQSSQPEADPSMEAQEVIDDLDVVVIESGETETIDDFEEGEIVVTEGITQALVASEEPGDDAAGEREAWRENARNELRRLSELNDGSDAPDQTLMPFNQDQVVEALNARLDRLSPELRQKLLSRIEELLDSEWLDVQTWQGIAYVLQIAAETQIDVLKRRLTGEYEVDAWGYDPEFADYLLPVAGFFFNRYWRIELTGVENIPVQGRTLLVSNHSGVLPLDGAMISYGVREHHAAHRLTRALVANWFPRLPFFSMILNKSGQVLAHPDNGQRLLEQEELVLVFPEGLKGVSKLFKERYNLARFGRGGFVRMAMQTKSPILPVSVVGAEETYPMLRNAKTVARTFGLPFFPITPTWPWLGPLGFVPVPSKWTIDIGEPIDTSQYDPDLVNNPAFVSELSDLVRNKVQEQINRRLNDRKSVIFG
jgi:1-acyl-sn-glycerol-3-phosphate acyltransferase